MACKIGLSAEAFHSLCLEDEGTVKALSDKFAVLIEVVLADVAVDEGTARVAVVRSRAPRLL